jgi:hypothetical protein
MPKYVMFVPDGTPIRAKVSASKPGLRGLIPGLSAVGSRQFLAGDIVTSESDRMVLADAFIRNLGLAARVKRSPIALLLPAIQAARETAKKIDRRLNLTAAGAEQFLSGAPVLCADDRKVLTIAVIKTQQARQLSVVADV